MDIRSLLVPLDGSSSDRRRLDAAGLLAERFKARVIALFARLPDSRVIAALGDAVSDRTIREAIERRAEDERRARDLFDAWCATGGPGVARASFGIGHGFPATVVARQARYADLTILSSTMHSGIRHLDPTIESRVLTQSGRPVLIVPPNPIASVGRAIVIAWNGSAEAARAVVGAMPFLVRASQVHVLTVLQRGLQEEDAAALVAFLTEHGVTADPMVLPVGQGVAATLLDAARRVGCDLLVMGAFARSPLREGLCGGVTDGVLGAADTSLLMSH